MMGIRGAIPFSSGENQVDNEHTEIKLNRRYLEAQQNQEWVS